MKGRFTPQQSPSRRRGQGPSPRKRMTVVAVLLGLCSVGLVVRAFDLQVVRKQFYQLVVAKSPSSDPKFFARLTGRLLMSLGEEKDLLDLNRCVG